MDKLLFTLKISQNILKITWNNIHNNRKNFKIQKKVSKHLYALNSLYKIFLQSCKVAIVWKWDIVNLEIFSCRKGLLSLLFSYYWSWAKGKDPPGTQWKFWTWARARWKKKREREKKEKQNENLACSQLFKKWR